MDGDSSWSPAGGSTIPPPFMIIDNGTSVDWTNYLVARHSILALISVLSILGNGLTIAAVAKFPSLQTPTNYIITSLAVADFLQPFGFGLSELFRELRDQVCFIYFDIVPDVVINIPMFSSVLHLLLITADRFVAVVYPLRYHSIVTSRLVGRLIGVTWVVAVLLSLSYYAWPAVYTSPYICGTFTIPSLHQIYMNAAAYMVVAVFMLILYAKIALIARKQRRQIQNMTGSAVPDNLAQSKQKKSSSMLYYVLTIYILAWVPFLVVSVVGQILLPQYWTGMFVTVITMLFLHLGLANCCFNAFVYAWRSKQFYDAYKKLLCNAWQ